MHTSERQDPVPAPATTVSGGRGRPGAPVRQVALAWPRRPVLAVLLAVVALTACSPDTETPPAADTATSSSPSATPEPLPSEPVPAPDEHSAVGELPDAFPTALLPVPPGAEILVSTLAPRGEPGAALPSDVSLNLRTDLPVADVAALYRASLTGAGFTETVGTPTEGLAAQSTYSRSGGAELVTVGILDRDGVRTVTVGGQVRTDG